MLRTRLPDWNLSPRLGYACVVRYGGIGDMIQAASVFPLLHAQGYKVTVNCHPTGAELLKSNPFVDELLVQERNYVPPARLQDFWRVVGRAFGKFVNLSESIEKGLLAWPGDPRYYTESLKDRRERCNVNYLERTHDIAGVPHTFHRGFFPTDAEKRWAAKEVRRLAGRHPLVMISLSGSSVHKSYPHWDAVIAWLMHATDAVVALVGDDYCRILEQGWQRERRVKCRSGRWSVRETLTLAEHSDLVVGTETGVMNAVGLLEVPKVLMLSHSSPENLSKHWRETTVIEPVTAKCYPCHKMHLKSWTCHKPPEHPDSKLAWCAYSIYPEQVQRAIAPILEVDPP